MSLIGDFAKGFLAMTVPIWVLNIVTLVILGYAWIGLLFFLILLIPISMMIHMFSRRKKNGRERVNIVERVKHILISLHGVSFACWVFDVGTTYYVIDILGVAAEQNPLGWPLGAIGVSVFHVPALAFTYLLLFKIKQRISLLTAILITVLSLNIGSMNLIAGFQNFSFFPHSVSLTVEAYYRLLFAVIAVDFIYAIAFAKFKIMDEIKPI